jgi:hypothetical protein
VPGYGNSKWDLIKEGGIYRKVAKTISCISCTACSPKCGGCSRG